jgi:hypothetical protein
MQCQVPICQNEIQGDGNVHALVDGSHLTITICDECEKKRQDSKPSYEAVADEATGEKEERFVWVWKNHVYASFIDAVNCPQCKQEIYLEKMWYDERRRIICTGCGLYFDTEFPKPVSLREANVWDGNGQKKLVKPGDTVKLLPVNPEKNENKEGRYLSWDNYKFHERRLGGGRGPYSISWIGLWPCGRVKFYVKTDICSGSEVYARDLMSV